MTTEPDAGTKEVLPPAANLTIVAPMTYTQKVLIAVGISAAAILLALLFFLATFALTRIVSLASLVATALTPLLLWILRYPQGHVVAGLIIAPLIIVRHHENIIRLCKGQEPKFSLGKSSASPAA